MDIQVQDMTPDYKRIYTDIINIRYPERKDDFKDLLDKQNISAADVLAINRRIFGNSTVDSEILNQKHKAYRRSDIFEMLNYQRAHNLNNSELARHFKVSRNTVAKWRRVFLM